MYSIKTPDMNDDIFLLISRHTPFAFYEVKRAYEALKSFDRVIYALDYSARSGLDIVPAVFDVLRNEIEIPAERLEVLYG